LKLLWYIYIYIVQEFFIIIVVIFIFITSFLQKYTESTKPSGKSKTSEHAESTLPWETLRGLFAFTVYGGRVDNPSDWRVLETYLRCVG
jgi:hypothetical protein